MTPIMDTACRPCLGCLRGTLPRVTNSLQCCRGAKKLANISHKTIPIVFSKTHRGVAIGEVRMVPKSIMRNHLFKTGSVDYLPRNKVAEQQEKEKLFAALKAKRWQYSQLMASKKLAQTQKYLDAETERELADSSKTNGRSSRAGREVNLHLLSPEEALQIVDEHIPAIIEIPRQVIVATPAPPSKTSYIKISSSIPRASQLSAAAAEAQAARAAAHGEVTRTPVETPDRKKAIYGSVSTADVVAELRSLLAQHEQGKRVRLLPKDLTFSDLTADIKDRERVKHLGTYDIQFQIGGVSMPIKRKIAVVEQAEETTPKQAATGPA